MKSEILKVDEVLKPIDWEGLSDIPTLAYYPDRKMVVMVTSIESNKEGSFKGTVLVQGSSIWRVGTASKDWSKNLFKHLPTGCHVVLDATGRNVLVPSTEFKRPDFDSKSQLVKLSVEATGGVGDLIVMTVPSRNVDNKDYFSGIVVYNSTEVKAMTVGQFSDNLNRASFELVGNKSVTIQNTAE